ncbi:hypothetical protein SNEBB_005704 [Seison nebaliae]|nr:hypothetical protein SNEBB_005704 [Seison nebaliae]
MEPNLTPYEQQRQCHEILVDAPNITVQPNKLFSELTCPICLDILQNTMTTKECLHRFCYDCIITALRAGNKECPTCRKKLVSKRSLRSDPNFNGLIEVLFPNRNEYEKVQTQMLEKYSKTNERRSSRLKRNLRKTKGKKYGKMKMCKMDEAEEDDEEEEEDDDGEVDESMKLKKKLEEANVNDDIDLFLLPRQKPEENRQEENKKRKKKEETNNDSLVSESSVELIERYVKTTINATIGHLSIYLGLRYTVESERKINFLIFLRVPYLIHLQKENNEIFLLSPFQFVHNFLTTRTTTTTTITSTTTTIENEELKEKILNIIQNTFNSDAIQFVNEQQQLIDEDRDYLIGPSTSTTTKNITTRTSGKKKKKVMDVVRWWEENEEEYKNDSSLASFTQLPSQMTLQCAASLFYGFFLLNKLNEEFEKNEHINTTTTTTTITTTNNEDKHSSVLQLYYQSMEERMFMDKI